ncbi:MAG: NUDIX hydrolase [Sulfolobales archaeon]|nr:NUDIX hydrolase [Sulfolobales archaeon]MDW8082505.1 NUDIX hydrolase [Sulfolobales archaeon]
MELLSESILCRGKRVVLTQRIYSHEGRRFIRDVVVFGESVAMLPVIDDRVILIKQFRAPASGWILEVPAGRVDPGESPEEAARRELVEEIGYHPGKLVKLSSIYTSPGYSDEVLHIYLAEKLEYVGSSPEPGELIEVVQIPIDEALSTVLNSPVADAKTLLSLLLLHEYSKKLQKNL